MIKCGTLRFITQKVPHVENFQVKKNVMRNLKPQQALYTGVLGGTEAPLVSLCLSYRTGWNGPCESDTQVLMQKVGI